MSITPAELHTLTNATVLDHGREAVKLATMAGILTRLLSESLNPAAASCMIDVLGKCVSAHLSESRMDVVAYRGLVNAIDHANSVISILASVPD